MRLMIADPILLYAATQLHVRLHLQVQLLFA